jgi:hypothetical protein
MRFPAGSLLLLFVLAAGTASRPSAAAVAQEAGDSLDLDGEWRFDTAEIVRVTHDGNSVRAEFVEGAACFDGRVRPYFLDGVLSGTTLTGTMMVCSRSPRLIEECGISSMYETTFEAAVEPDRISGTRVAQGLATEEEGGRYVSCVPDSRYDGSYDFDGVSCTGAERELAELNERLDSMLSEGNAIEDHFASTTRSGNWLAEDYAGPKAEQAARWRDLQAEMALVVEQRNAARDPAEAAGLDARLEDLVAESGPLEDELSLMNATDWTKDDYIGSDADQAARWRQLQEDAVALLPRINERMERVAECAREECPDPAEAQQLLARVDALTNELNGIADQIASTPSGPDWFEEGYAGPNAEMATRWRAISAEMLGLVVESEATEDPAERATIEARIDALGAEMRALDAELNAMNLTNWLEDDYVGPDAELAARYRALESEALEVLAQLQAVEERRRACAEGVG